MLVAWSFTLRIVNPSVASSPKPSPNIGKNNIRKKFISIGEVPAALLKFVSCSMRVIKRLTKKSVPASAPIFSLGVVSPTSLINPRRVDWFRSNYLINILSGLAKTVRFLKSTRASVSTRKIKPGSAPAFRVSVFVIIRFV